MRVNEQTENKEWLAFNLCNISSIYEKQGNYSEALEKLNEAGKLVDKSGTMFLFPVYYLYMGTIYEKQSNYKSALDNYFKYSEGCKKANYSDGQAYASNFIGVIYQKQGDYAKALKLFFSSLATFQKNKYDLEIAEISLNIGNTYRKQNNYSDAAKYLKRALNVANKIGSNGFAKQCYEYLSELENTNGNTATAFAYYKLYITYRDSIINSENTKISLGLQLQYDTEKKEQQISLLTKDTQLQQVELKKQNTTRNAFICGLVLVALLAGITYNRYRIKKRANTEIEKTLTHLKNTQGQIIEREKLASLGKLTVQVAKEIEVPVFNINQLNIKNRTLLNNIKSSKLFSATVTVEDLKNNLRHIYRYGKDADGIVKKVLTETRKLQG